MNNGQRDRVIAQLRKMAEQCEVTATRVRGEPNDSERRALQGEAFAYRNAARLIIEAAGLPAYWDPK